MNEAIILAGGAGTRLRTVTGGGQKVVVSVGDKTFLEILIQKLRESNFKTIHLAVGYKAEEVSQVILKQSTDIQFNLIHEKKPLGTGGAIKNALEHVSSENVLVMNGDTFNELDYSVFLKQHVHSNADISILTKVVNNISRYGEVVLDRHQKIIKFREKKGKVVKGRINLGVYGLKRSIFENYREREFSIENYFTKNVRNKSIMSINSHNSFMDIGTPEDYYQFINGQK